jgi:hypothetical protein
MPAMKHFDWIDFVLSVLFCVCVAIALMPSDVAACLDSFLTKLRKSI